jgi:hypothetical protein
MRRILAAIVAVDKRISIIYSECLAEALIIQHALGMRPVVFCGLPALQYFLHIIIKNGTIS